jgi:hypothetical protein
MDDHPQPAARRPAAAPRRRWFQFRLKWLLVFITVLAAPLSWLGWTLEEKRRERWAEAELQKFALQLIHDAQSDDPFAEELPPGPACGRAVAAAVRTSITGFSAKAKSG